MFKSGSKPLIYAIENLLNGNNSSEKLLNIYQHQQMLYIRE